MSPCIMGLTTQDLYILKEYTELYKILKFRVNWANIKQDAAFKNLNTKNELPTLVRKYPEIHTFLSKFWSF